MGYFRELGLCSFLVCINLFSHCSWTYLIRNLRPRQRYTFLLFKISNIKTILLVFVNFPHFLYHLLKLFIYLQSSKCSKHLIQNKHTINFSKEDITNWVWFDFVVDENWRQKNFNFSEYIFHWVMIVECEACVSNYALSLKFLIKDEVYIRVFL